jgi:hypothetical protein
MGALVFKILGMPQLYIAATITICCTEHCKRIGLTPHLDFDQQTFASPGNPTIRIPAYAE